jgi:hypothetical protein
MRRGQKFLKGLTHNLVLKLIALALAIITWFYINEELNKEKMELQWHKDFLGLMESEGK